MGSLQRAQGSQVVLSVGGRRFHTSTATLRSKPGTMLAAMFSGRYGMERDDDGSVFIDRDGRYFEHVLSFLRDDDMGAEDLGVPALRQLKREFAYYGIELQALQATACVLGGTMGEDAVSSVYAYNPSDDAWSAAAPMQEARSSFGAANVGDRMYVVGGDGTDGRELASMEVYDAQTRTWSVGVPLPAARYIVCVSAVSINISD